MSLVHRQVIKIVDAMDYLSDMQITKGQVVEEVEYLTVQQRNWREGSIGWLVLETTKNYIRVVLNPDNHDIADVLMAESEVRSVKIQKLLAEINMLAPTSMRAYMDFMQQYVRNLEAKDYE